MLLIMKVHGVQCSADNGLVTHSITLFFGRRTVKTAGMKAASVYLRSSRSASSFSAATRRPISVSH